MLTTKKQPMTKVSTNMTQGSYRPWFFDNAEFKISKVNFSSHFYSEDDVETTLLKGDFSFAYLRDDKLRTIDVIDYHCYKLKFEDFLERFSIKINSNNLFKTSKYLSRVFRPVKYGAFYKGLNIHLNEESHLTTKITDGISLISLDLARSLGWKSVENGMSAQFTLFSKDGMVKGHCVVSDSIKHDVVIYGKDNIKSEISFDSDTQYIALEPVKLSKTLRLDVQSLINLWGLFGGEQYLEWAYDGIERFKDDLFNGRLCNWLDNFDDITADDLDKEQWILRKAIWHKVDYTLYPGLIRAAWTMFRSSLIRYASDSKGNPTFRIPVPGGVRGYLRVDLRNHNCDGSFSSTLESDEVEIDGHGNIWFSPNGLTETLSILGGADLDDSLCVIPIEDGKAVIYRNPNQYGEYVIKKIVKAECDLEGNNKLVGTVPIKQVAKDKLINKQKDKTGNSLLDQFLSNRSKPAIPAKEYNLTNLLRTFNKISTNTSNIGVAANAEMLLSSIYISHPAKFRKLRKMFSWNLERIIDATVKDGTDAGGDMEVISKLHDYICENQIPLPESLLQRIPSRKRDTVKIAKKHKLDELHSAIEHLVKAADLEILGEGAASSGRRIPGRIDELNIPLNEIGLSAIESRMYDLAVSILKDYNKSMAIMLNKTSSLSTVEEESIRKSGIDKILLDLLKRLSMFSDSERSELAKVFAYEIYKTEKAVHDSILWIRDRDGFSGTGNHTIAMLSNLGLAEHIKSNGSLKRFREINNLTSDVHSIRLWSKESLRADIFANETEVCIAGNEALLGTHELNIGDECNFAEGIYKIKSIVNTRSRKQNNRVLKNSLTIYLG